jgi:3-oxoadipate enol-lactonase
LTTVYLHPVGLDGALWHDVAVEDSLTPHFPGFGDTALDGPVSFDRLVEHVAGLLTEPADLVGMSLGSMVAQHVAVRRPDVVRSLVLCCGAAATKSEVSLARAEATRQGGMKAVLDTTLDRWFSAQTLGQQGHPGVEYARRRLLTDDPEVFAAYWQAMAEHDLRTELGAVRVPTTVLAGEQDRAVSVADMRELADHIPRSRFEVVPGPHILHLENPDGFTDVVRRHLRWVQQ